MSTENLQEQLDEIQSARDNIQTTLESKGETVSNDIRTFATAVNNLGNINTVNGIGADENRNAQLDASNINIDDTSETTQTIKEAIEEVNTELDTKVKTPSETTPSEVISVYGSSNNDMSGINSTGVNTIKIRVPQVRNDGIVTFISGDIESSDGSINLGNILQDKADFRVKSENVEIYTVDDKGNQSTAKLGETIRSILTSITELNTDMGNAVTKTEAEPFISEVTFDNSTFTFTFKNYKGETQTFDLPLESTVKSGRYDSENKALVLVLQSDDEVSIPVNELCDVYTGVDGAKVKVTVNSNNEIEATIKEGTIAKADLAQELQEEIANKVNSETFDKLGASVETLEASIVEKADKTELDAKVDTETFNEFKGDTIDSLAGKADTASVADLNEDIRNINTQIDNLSTEVDLKATTEYVDNAVANIDMPEFDTTELETSISNLEANKADKTELDTKVDVEDYEQYKRDNMELHSTQQENISKKLDKSEIVKEFAPNETYSDTQVYNANAVNVYATAAAETLLKNSMDIEGHKTEIADLKTADTTLQTNIDAKLDKSEIVKELAPMETYTENQVYNATAVNNLATTLATDLLKMTTKMDANTTAIANNKEAVDTEITNLKAKDTELEEAIANVGTVKSVNNYEPSENGNVQVSGRNIRWSELNEGSQTPTMYNTYNKGIITVDKIIDNMVRTGTSSNELIINTFPEKTEGENVIKIVENSLQLNADGNGRYYTSGTGKQVKYNSLSSKSGNIELDIISTSTHLPRITIDAVPENLAYNNTNSGLTSTTFQAAIDELATDINNVSVPEYSIKETTTTEGYAKTYSMTKDGAEIGVKIDIPKDLVVNSGTVKEVTTANTPYTGASVGDKYIDLVLNDSSEDHIFIPVKDLVDVYTGSEGEKVRVTIGADNTISADIVRQSISLDDIDQEFNYKLNMFDSNLNRIDEEIWMRIEMYTDPIHTELDEHKGLIDTNTTNISDLTERMEGAESAIVSANTKINNTNTNVSNLTTRVSNVETKANTNETNITNLTTTVGNKADKSALTTLEGKVTTNTNNISNINTEITNLKTKDTELEEAVANAGTVKSVNSVSPDTDGAVSISGEDITWRAGSTTTLYETNLKGYLHLADSYTGNKRYYYSSGEPEESVCTRDITESFSFKNTGTNEIGLFENVLAPVYSTDSNGNRSYWGSTGTRTYNYMGTKTDAISMYVGNSPSRTPKAFIDLVPANIKYDNKTSGLSSTTMQTAIDEVATEKADKSYVDNLKIVQLLENSESYVNVDNHTPIQCVRLNTETGIEAEDLDRLKCLKLSYIEVRGFGTCVKQTLDIIGENYEYTRFNEGMNSAVFNSWYKESKNYMTEQQVDRKLSQAIENTDITYTVTNDGDYGFIYRSATGWYCSMNAGINSTTSACDVTFNKDINGDVKLRYKVSSESGWDWLSVYVNGNQIDKISGEKEGYTTIDYLAKGSTVRFEYSKDGSSQSGDDCGFFKICFNDIKTMIEETVENATSSAGGASSTMGTELFMNYDANAGVTTYLNDSVENYQLIEIIYGNISSGTETDMMKSIKVRPNSVALLSMCIVDYDEEMSLLDEHRMTSKVNVYGSSLTVREWANEIHAKECIGEGGMDSWYHRYGNDLAIYAVYGHGVAEDAGGGPVACFVGDTKVAVKGGYKNIADIQIGDKVYSYNAETGKKELKEVDKLVNHEVNRIYNFRAGKENIKSSWTHPFHVAGKGKLNACEISAGYKFQNSKGEEISINKVMVENVTETVYEIRVKDNNNYFVGDNEFLVYNEDVVINDKEDEEIKVEKK